MLSCACRFWEAVDLHYVRFAVSLPADDAR